MALVWGLFLAPGALEKVGFLELFQEARMDSPEIEIGREAFGLLLIAGWMLVLALPTWSGRASSSSVSGL